MALIRSIAIWPPARPVEQIDTMNAWLHDNINTAVYTVGFASEQRDYELKVAKLFRSLDELDSRLTNQPYLLGNTITESDLYLLATLVRFDTIYYPLFRCTYRRIADYPALSDYLRRLEETRRHRSHLQSCAQQTALFL